MSLQLCFKFVSEVSASSSSELHWQEPFPVLLNLWYKGYHTLNDSLYVFYCSGYFQCFVLVMCFVQGISHYSNLNCNLTKNINEKCVHYTVVVLRATPPRYFKDRITRLKKWSGKTPRFILGKQIIYNTNYFNPALVRKSSAMVHNGTLIQIIRIVYLLVTFS